jgi:hypothetical protein
MLDGTLNVALTNSVVPAVPNDFTVITGASVTGSFTTTNLPDTGGWSIRMLSGTSVVLKSQ